ncbi:MAG: PoNe immunity protein domain-containing protein [Flavobacteriaceae bacterium]
MRSRYKDREYFESRIEFAQTSEERRLRKIQNGEISQKRIYSVLVDISGNYLRSMRSRYSAGDDISNMKNDLDKSIEYLLKGASNGFGKLKYSATEIYDQYGGSFYEQVLSILSVCFLLNSSSDHFNKIAQLIDRDRVQDLLFEFIIRQKVNGRKELVTESYQKYFKIPETYKGLREAIKESDKRKVTQLIDKFITKEWYSNHKEFGWYESHKKDNEAYTGYWSFETAVIVVILNIDDTNFRDNEYYPKDLVDYYRANQPI